MNIIKAFFRPFDRTFDRILLDKLEQVLFTCSHLRHALLNIVMSFIDDARVEGSYLEFGVFTGRAFTDAFHAAQKHKKLHSMKFYAFDSFEGLPEPEETYADGTGRYRKGEYACGIDKFKENISNNGVDLNKVTCVAGWYNEVLNEEMRKSLPIKKAAVVYIDCDLYESTVSVLNFITDYIQDGTVMIFDDWYSYKGRLDRGEARAFGEWLKKNPSIKATEYHKAHRTMMSFIMHVD